MDLAAASKRLAEESRELTKLEVANEELLDELDDSNRPMLAPLNLFVDPSTVPNVLVECQKCEGRVWFRRLCQKPGKALNRCKRCDTAFPANPIVIPKGDTLSSYLSGSSSSAPVRPHRSRD